ncbi:MAG: TolC family protein, partial [Planctomycetota bacterium]
GALSPLIASAQYRAARAVFDPLLSAEFRYDRKQTPSVFGFFGQNVTTDRTLGGSAGVNQFLSTGGTVSFLYRADRISTDQTIALINPAWSNRLVVEGAQPLLRGAGDIVMADIRLAHNQVVGAREDQRALREQTLVEVVQAYWDLARAQEILIARRKSEEAADRLYRNAKARLEAKMGTPLDVAEARAGPGPRRGDRTLQEGARAARQDVLGTLIMPFALRDNRGIRFVAVDDVETARIVSPDLDQMDRYVKLALENRPEMKSAEAGLASRRIDVVSAANGVLPQVDLVGSIGTAAVETGLSDSLSSMLTGQGVSAGIGVRFSMFVGQRAARSRLRLTEWARRQSVIQYKDLANQVIAQVRAGVRDVITAQAVLETAKAGVVAAKANLEGEVQKLLQGRSTPFDVLLKEETVTDARLTLATAAVAVRNAEARFWRAVGMLGQKLGLGGGFGGRRK